MDGKCAGCGRQFDPGKSPPRIPHPAHRREIEGRRHRHQIRVILLEWHAQREAQSAIDMPRGNRSGHHAVGLRRPVPAPCAAVFEIEQRYVVQHPFAVLREVNGPLFPGFVQQANVVDVKPEVARRDHGFRKPHAGVFPPAGQFLRTDDGAERNGNRFRPVRGRRSQ